MSGKRRMGSSSWKCSARYSLWIVGRDTLRERNLLEATETSFLFSFFEC